MTSPLAIVGLTYDSTDVQAADLQIFLEIVQGLNEPPAVRGSDSVVPARAGRTEGNRKNDVLPLELRGCVTSDPALTDLADQRASFRTNQIAVRALFHTSRARAPLVATLEDGSVLTISARPLSAVWTEVVAGEYSNVSIELEGYDDWATAV